MAILRNIARLRRAAWYYHVKQQARPDKYSTGNAEIPAIFHENKDRYGYQRMMMELRSRDCALRHKTVQRWMKELGLVCKVRMKKYRSCEGEVGRIAPNLLAREFRIAAPDQKWVNIVTGFHLFGQKLYLPPIPDLCSWDIVSKTSSDRSVLSMVTGMPDKAFTKIPGGALILHSDQGRHDQHQP